MALCPKDCTASTIAKCTFQIFLNSVSVHGNRNSSIPGDFLVFKSALPPLLSSSYKRTESNLKSFLPFLVTNPKKGLVKVVPPDQVVVSDEKQIIKPLFHSSGDGQELSLQIRNALVNDKTYQSFCLDTMLQLVDPSSIMLLVQSSLFARIWRELWKSKTMENRSLFQELSKKFTQCQSFLEKSDAEMLKKWIDDSYNSDDIIQSTIDKLAITSQSPAIVLETSQTSLKPKQILNLGTSNLSSSLLKEVSSLLSSLRLISSSPPAKTPYLPLGLQNSDLFTMLPSLFTPGLVVSPRLSCIFALMAGLTRHPILKTRAKEYLISMKGKWISLDSPDSANPIFLRLISKLKSDTFLLEQERFFIKRMGLLHGILRNENTDCIVQCPATLVKCKRPDRMLICSQCQNPCSFTLLTSDAVCPPCKAQRDTTTISNDLNDQSVFSECKDCKSLYANIDPSKVSSSPKCFYCRSGVSVSRISCGKCFQTFLDPSSTISKERLDGSTFECPSCVSGISPLVESYTITCRSFIEYSVENGDCLLRKLGLNRSTDEKGPLFGDLFSSKNPFRLGRTLVLANQHSVTEKSMKWNGKPILNSSEVLDSLSDWIISGSKEQATCEMCYQDDLEKDQIYTVCGRKGCAIKACADCLVTWYGDANPGHLLVPTRLLCPFCQRKPDGGVMAKYNPQACTLLGLGALDEFDPAWHYGWCIGCFKPKKMLEKVCGADNDFQGMTQFNCELCSTSNRVYTRDCPSCNVAIEKISGCDHITCRQCNGHWCWRCGKVFDVGGIYPHLSHCQGDEIYRDFLNLNRDPARNDNGDDDDDYWD